jgi:hypothetical protein
MTKKRTELQDAVAAIPTWKRWIICRILKRKEHKVAYAYSVVACDLIYANDDRFEWARGESDRRWAELYGIEWS